VAVVELDTGGVASGRVLAFEVQHLDVLDRPLRARFPTFIGLPLLGDQMRAGLPIGIAGSIPLACALMGSTPIWAPRASAAHQVAAV
jgi:hypothetical protein